MTAPIASSRFFVDTNVLLYTLDPRDAARQSAAREWVDRLWFHGIGAISWQVLNEFYQAGRYRLKFPDDTLRRDIETLVLWSPVPNTLSLTRRAWFWIDHASIHYWDALVVAAAEHAGCSYLLTEDLQAGRKLGGVTVVNPFLHSPAEFGLSTDLH